MKTQFILIVSMICVALTLSVSASSCAAVEPALKKKPADIQTVKLDKQHYQMPQFNVMHGFYYDPADPRKNGFRMIRVTGDGFILIKCDDTIAKPQKTRKPSEPVKKEKDPDKPK